MKKISFPKNVIFKITLPLWVFLMASVNLLAQKAPEVKVNGSDVGYWFSAYWPWVVGIIVILVLIIIFGNSSSSRNSTTTIVKDKYGDTKRTTTTTESL